MSEGFTTKSLGDVVEFQRGLTYSKGDEVDASTNVVLRATNIDLNTNLLDLAELRFISDKFSVPPGKRVRKDSLLICTASGSKSHLGKVAYIDEDYGYAFGGFMGMLTPKAGLLPRYLFHLMTSNAYKEFIDGLSDGANINNLKFDDLARFQVPLLPLPEQRRIVAILDEAFAAIASAKANAEKNLQNARAVFESDLASIFTNRGSDWTMRTLAEVSAVFGRGKSRHRPRNEPSLYGGKYPFVQTGDVRNAVDVIKTYTQTYSEKGLAQSKLWPKGTVCITIAANIAESAILGFDSCFPDSMIGAVPDRRETTSEFLLFLLQSFKAHLQAQGKGSAQHNINMGTFENQPFPFPPLEEQAAIVARLSQLRQHSGDLAETYTRKLAALASLKSSLLHHTFTGQLTAESAPRQQSLASVC